MDRSRTGLWNFSTWLVYYSGQGRSCQMKGYPIKSPRFPMWNGEKIEGHACKNCASLASTLFQVGERLVLTTCIFEVLAMERICNITNITIGAAQASTCTDFYFLDRFLNSIWITSNLLFFAETDVTKVCDSLSQQMITYRSVSLTWS